MEVRTRSELARFATLVLAAIGELEELNAALEAALLVDSADQPAGRPFERLWLLIGFRPAQLEQAARTLPAVVAALDALPDEAVLPAVGPVLVTSARTAAAAPTWSERLAPTPNRRAMVARVQEVRAEVTWALGDLERARLRARLAAMRLNSA